MVTIKQTARQLVEIAEKSPGYAVDVLSKESGVVCTLTNLRFARTAKGRRNRFVVYCDCVHDGVTYHSVHTYDVVFNVLD